jgi:FixJ family two-component response regulator
MHRGREKERLQVVDRKPFVCVIDDDVSLRRALYRLLRAAGYEVEVLDSAQAYLDRKNGREPACLLLDVRMPDMSGLELQRRIAGKDAPSVVFITAHDDARAKREAMALGAIDFLLKPLDDAVLLDAVQRAVERSRP